MSAKEKKGIPITDQEAIEMLLGGDPSDANFAAVRIYKIKRAQGKSVLDAYEATLSHWIAIGEKTLKAKK